MFDYFTPVSEQDLQSLIDNEARETKFLEFKQSLPGPEASEKIKLLKVVSSFANAAGGTVIYGISEDRSRGVAKELVGVGTGNVDQELRGIEASIRSGIEPRLHGAKIEAVPLGGGRSAIVIRVQRSWNAPHRVTLGGHDRFYARNSSGAHPMDVSELKAAFLATDTLTERIRSFRRERVSQIFAAEMPVPMLAGPKVILHLIPFDAFTLGTAYEIKQNGSTSLSLPPMDAGSWNYRYTLEGFINFAPGQADRPNHAYAHLYRQGIVEAVSSLMFVSNEARSFSATGIENSILKSFPRYLSVLKSMGVALPICAAVTVVDIKDCCMYLDPGRFWRDNVHRVDRAVLLLPELLLDTYEVHAPAALRPTFDSLWNACGYERSFNYDEDGNRRAR